MTELVVTVSEFVALLNQTLEIAYPQISVVGELANFRVSKNRWVYFDLKDEESVVRCFGTIYSLPGPLEDGLLVKVVGRPRLHNQYGFSITIQSILPTGEGSIKKAANLLEAKLRAEGLFDIERKRLLPYPPTRIGLMTSSESAAYSDFLKVLNKRWGGVHIKLIDVQVQGERAVNQLITSVRLFNEMAEPPDVLVIIRGGGSAEDLQAFGVETVVRAIASSRIPTLVAIGHERDVSLAELSADQRASTPSNAAELLVPDKQERLTQLQSSALYLSQSVRQIITNRHAGLRTTQQLMAQSMNHMLRQLQERSKLQRHLLATLDPYAPLQRGYALVSKQGTVVHSAGEIELGDTIAVRMKDGMVTAITTIIEGRRKK